MGYELKLYLGSYFDLGFQDEDDDKYFSVVAFIDLCKVGESNLTNIKTEHRPKVYFYGIDGNTRLSSDPYGDYLKATPAQIVLNALKKDLKESKKDYPEKGYRRFYMAVPILERFIETFKDENPCVVMYGH